MLKGFPLISRIPKNKFWVTNPGEMDDIFTKGENIHLIVNPAIETYLSAMTARETDLRPYREAARRSSDMLFLEASHKMSTFPIEINTSWGQVPGVQLAGNPLFISILRGAWPLVSCVECYYPDSPIVQLSASRDKDNPWNAHLNTTNTKFPCPANWHNVIIDQTFATGGTVFASTGSLKTHKLISEDDASVTNLTLICTFTAVPGLQRIFEAFPNIHIYTSRIIFGLDDKCYMIGGPGDAGLRCTYTIADLKRMDLY